MWKFACFSLGLALVGCGGPSDDTLLSELTASEAEDVCEEGRQDSSTNRENTCLITATLPMGTMEECMERYNACLAETDPVPPCSDARATMVPDGCLATVGDARACSADSRDLIAQAAAERSCANPGQPLPSILAPSCGAFSTCVQMEVPGED